MMVEVARISKPLAIFPLPYRQNISLIIRQRLVKLLHPAAGTEKEGDISEPLEDFLYRLDMVLSSRDLTAFHRLLVERGLAVQLGTPFLSFRQKAPAELPYVVKRIKALLNHHL